MSLVPLVVAAGIVVSGLVCLLLVAVACVHLGRTRRLQREEQRRAELTPLVLGLLDEDGDSPARGLASAPAVLDDVVLDLLPRLRGSDRRLLQQVLITRGVVARAAEDLDARAAWRRGRAAALLGSVGSRYHTAELVALLADRTPAVRCAAARALGKAGDPAAVGPLLRTLSRSRPVPGGVVGMAVLDLGTPVLPALRTALSDGAAPARILAAELLGLHGDLAAAPALESALTDRTQPAAVRRAAAGALGRIGSPSSTGVLVQALTLTAVQCTAAEALGRIGDPFAIPALAAGLNVPAPDVRAACAGALAHLGTEGQARLTVLAAGHGPAADAARAALDAVLLSPRRQAVAV